MRTIVALLVILVGSGPAFADRAMSIAQDLHLSPEATANVAVSLARYDADLYRLRADRAELKRQLLLPHTDSMSQQMVDDMIANARALVVLDENLVASLRAQLAPDQLLHVFMMLSATEPEAPRMMPPLHPGAINKPTPPPPTTTTASAQTQSCDPFSSMHGCPR